MQMLQYSHRNLTLLEGSYALGRGSSGGDSGERRDAMRHGGPPNGLLVKPWVLPLRSIDDELNASTFDQIDGVGTAFLHFVNALDLKAGVLEDIGSAVCGDQLKAEIGEAAAEFSEMGLVTIGDADEDGPSARQ